MVDRDNPFVQALGAGIALVVGRSDEQISVGRHGASDATAFLDVGVPGGGVRPFRRRPSRP